MYLTHFGWLILSLQLQIATEGKAKILCYVKKRAHEEVVYPTVHCAAVHPPGARSLTHSLRPAAISLWRTHTDGSTNHFLLSCLGCFVFGSRRFENRRVLSCFRDSVACGSLPDLPTSLAQ